MSPPSDTRAWGGRDAPLLPLPLRRLWADEPLPDGICDDLALARGSTFAALASGPFPADPARSQRVQAFLSERLTSNLREISDVPIVGLPLSTRVHVDELPVRPRTWNSMERHHLAPRSIELPYVTFGQLFDVHTVGPIYVLDFACGLEAVCRSTRVEPEPLGAEDAAAANAAMAAAINTLDRALDEPWAAMISELDRRFAPLLTPGTGSVADRIHALVDAPHAHADDILQLAAAMGAIRDEVMLIELVPLEAALAGFVSATAGVTDAKLAALLARLHLSGKVAPITLREAGARAKKSPEYIRQVQERFAKRMPPHPVFLPQLDRALQCMHERAPMHALQACAHLTKNEIVKREFRPESVLAAAQLFGRSACLGMKRILHEPVVDATRTRPYVDLVLREADRLLAGAGVANTQSVAALLRDNHALALDEAAVRDVLVAYGGAEFLYENWFWIPGRGIDPLRSAVRRVLSVSYDVYIASLEAGIRRLYRFREHSASPMRRPLLPPPLPVLTAWIHSQPEFVLTRDIWAGSVLPLDYVAELGTAESMMVDIVLAADGRTMDRASLLDGAASFGIDMASATASIEYSPVFASLEGDRWTVRGTAAESARFGVELPEPPVEDAVAQLRSRAEAAREMMGQAWGSY